MTRSKIFGWALALTCAASLSLSAQQPDQVDKSATQNSTPHFTVHGPKLNFASGQAHARFGIAGLDSIANFNGHYFTPGFDSSDNPQNEWFTNTVGNPPQMGGTTYIQAPIIPVRVHLMLADGVTPRLLNGVPMIVDPTPFIQPFVNSPVFQDSTYSSSQTPTQFTDAVQRAEFFGAAKPDWHTVLVPSVKTTRDIYLPQGKYRFATNADGTCCAFVLADDATFSNLLFPAVASDTTTPIGAAENAHEMTTKDMTTLLFPNTYLYEGVPSNCCVLGYHTFDVEPGDATNGNAYRAYVVNYSSWISPGLFGGGFQDVTANSHEIAESFNDPFVAFDGIHDITPWWKSGGNCQNDLEDGDVIEGLANATYPVTLNNFTYHPQNEALLQWFEFEAHSSAIDGAYSYPNELTLTQLSPVEHAKCQAQ